ncbi:hypothetical protein QAD02_004968 [Eretmocerus hayati]|uniref:Uncharacterized protein n=1 Tax=Eretmocerus hayati TaxID=131215 RepID=A0ACC2NSY7_9HYME|nr:hypothetical protein QAD02_004968 [Eretmocerus hayati]
MDVDLLRPGTVPISPDTVLWFEFLLDPSLLLTHISKPSPDPSPTDLIIKFMTINADQSNDVKVVENEANNTKVNPVNKWTYKNLALKILSLKVTAYLEWDLDVLQKKLPLQMQVTLFQDLFYIVMDLVVEIPVVLEDQPDTASDRVLFTLVLYHRWLLRAIIYRSLNNIQLKAFAHNPALLENNFAPTPVTDEIVRKLESQATSSVDFLKSVLQLSDVKPKVLSFDTFQMLTENSTEIKQNWDNVQSITEEEWKCQIHYDLATFYLLREDYKSSRHHICQARDLFTKLDKSKPMQYCKIKEEDLMGYCLACGVPVEGKISSLVQQLLLSIKDQYSNILQILQTDNIAREIPLVYRDNLELDIEGGLVNRKIVVARDLLLQIQCLNLVRRIVDNETIIGDYISHIKAAGSKGLEILFWALDHILEKGPSADRQRIARYLLYLVIMGDVPGLASAILGSSNLKSLFSADELQEIQREAVPEDLDIPNLLLNNDWDIPSVDFIQKQRMDVFELEQRLISSYNPHEIRHILKEIERLTGSSYTKPLWQINNTWNIPIPFQSVISSIPEGNLKTFSYILLAKSKELAAAKDFSASIFLLNFVKNEVQHHEQTINQAPQPLLGGNNILFKLTKLLSWELLLTDICYCLHAWPANKCDTKNLIFQAKQCLATFQSSDQPFPRIEIVEYCTIFLLNMAEWEYLTSLEKQWSCLEFAAALSNVAKHNKSQKIPKEAWDMVLTACKPARDMPQKRSNSGPSGNNISKDPSTLSIVISTTFSQLREVTVLNIAISLLARLHNILRDEQSLELYTTYLNMWPTTILNPKLYNMRVIGEQLFQLLSQALKYYPNNVPWLRLMGDLNFVLGFYESAMKYYLKAIIVNTDLFTLSLRNQRDPNQIDDLVFRRMIKCCAHLQCYTQAVVLCQFLDEVDYALAFKMAGNEQKNAAPNDAMDAYYHCIWDTTILEYLINLHTKRGEHHRKQLAIKAIGLLELNSNNNEEIQREAANTRKGKFLRALAKQYVY